MNWYYFPFFYRLGMYRDAERQVISALKQQPMIDSYLLLAKCNVKLDQPITAIDTYKKGLEKFPNDTSLMTGIARIYEVVFFVGCFARSPDTFYCFTLLRLIHTSTKLPTKRLTTIGAVTLDSTIAANVV